MTSRRPVLASLAIAMTALAAARAGAGTERAIAGEKYALIVGVQEYEGDVSSLRYAEGDAIALFEVLREVVKVPADHIVLMTQRGNASFRRTPTKAHILEQLELLLSG